MPSSFVDSVPGVVHLLEKINPRAIVDIGPGWGKYGLMVREYFPEAIIDYVEVPEGRLPTQDVIYNSGVEADARTLPGQFWEGYECALLIDVIEHMSVLEGKRLLSAIQKAGCHVIVSTPKVFEEQHDDRNPFEEHVSLWTWKHFKSHGIVNDQSTIDSIIYWLGAR